MTQIFSSCDECGPVELLAKFVTLKICENYPEVSYEFQCPICHNQKEDQLDPKHIHVESLKRCRDINIHYYTIPEEVFESKFNKQLESHEIADFVLDMDDELEALLKGEGNDGNPAVPGESSLP